MRMNILTLLSNPREQDTEPSRFPYHQLDEASKSGQ